MQDIEAQLHRRFKHGRQSVARKIGLGGCYVVGPDEAGPVKIGYAADPLNRIASMQSGNWCKLFLFDLVWFKGPLIAERVESGALVSLRQAGLHIRGEWFNADAEMAASAIRASAKALGFEWMSELARRNMIEWEHKREFKRFAAIFKK